MDQVEHTFDNPVTTKKSINWIKIFVIVLGNFAVLGVGMYLGSQFFSQNQEKVPLIIEEPRTIVAEPTSSQPINLPTVVSITEPVIVGKGVGENAIIQNIAYSFDQNKYAFDSFSTYGEYPAVNIIDISSQQQILSMIDVSSIPASEKSDVRSLIENAYLSAGGLFEDSDLRDVVVEGKPYSFIRTHFGDGAPGEKPGCFSGGGVVSDFVMLNTNIVVQISNSYDSEWCEGESQDDTMIYKHSDSQIEEALKIIESIESS